MKLLLLATLLQLSLFQANISPVASFEPCDGQRFYTQCGGGGMCQYIQICLGSMQELKHCPTVDFTKPYCNQGECSETPEFAVGADGDGECPPRTIYCTGAGIFPDPDICSLYHDCAALDTMSSVLQCPTGEVFDPETLACKPQTNPADCMKIKCDVNELLSRYGTSKQFYGYCEISFGSVPNTVTRVFKCPEGTSFNGKSCSFGCPDVGRFADSANPSVYYECLEGVQEAIKMVCPPGKVFDSTRSACRTPSA